MIDRRTFLAGTGAMLLAAPLAAEGQQAGKVPRIGWLGGPTRETAQPFVQPFLQWLKDLGWVEGQNIIIEWRFAGGRAERLPGLAAELVRLRVDLIVVTANEWGEFESPNLSSCSGANRIGARWHAAGRRFGSHSSFATFQTLELMSWRLAAPPVHVYGIAQSAHGVVMA